MHAKPSFAHCLQTAKIAYSDTCAQNNGPSAQNNGPSAQNNDSSTQNNGPSAQKNGPIAQSILLERNSELVLWNILFSPSSDLHITEFHDLSRLQGANEARMTFEAWALQCVVRYRRGRKLTDAHEVSVNLKKKLTGAPNKRPRDFALYPPAGFFYVCTVLASLQGFRCPAA